MASLPPEITLIGWHGCGAAGSVVVALNDHVSETSTSSKTVVVQSHNHGGWHTSLNRGRVAHKSQPCHRSPTAFESDFCVLGVDRSSSSSPHRSRPQSRTTSVAR